MSLREKKRICHSDRVWAIIFSSTNHIFIWKWLLSSSYGIDEVNQQAYQETTTYRVGIQYAFALKNFSYAIPDLPEYTRRKLLILICQVSSGLWRNLSMPRDLFCENYRYTFTINICYSSWIGVSISNNKI